MNKLTTICEACGQLVLPHPPPPPPSPKASPEVLDGDTSLEDAFDALEVSLPLSIRKKVAGRLEKKNLAPDSPEAKAILEKAAEQYTKKKEAARVASAKRRAAKKELQASEVAEAEPV